MTSTMPIDPDLLAKIEDTRREALAAALDADDAEQHARSKRRHAKNLMRRYEKLVQEHMGQLAFMPEESLQGGQQAGP